ncbi:hypothetical protein Y032_0156g3141 [Ancylostoma ceylanicum]|uniref:Uncharacterized protein n=1 Tax=Ancylostoma ceylanicum TaxID=53326 RepID=A0A016SZG3_9BILA|nr:hypothetical protein Y032_0156g3141 [Ancylostoma ceylanicum]
MMQLQQWNMGPPAVTQYRGKGQKTNPTVEHGSTLAVQWWKRQAPAITCAHFHMTVLLLSTRPQSHLRLVRQPLLFLRFTIKPLSSRVYLQLSQFE